MEEQVMVHKANQIALFFTSYARDEAIEGIETHIRLYWEPRMRRQIIEYVAGGGAGLHEYAVEAVKRLAPVAPR